MSGDEPQMKNNNSPHHRRVAAFGVLGCLLLTCLPTKAQRRMSAEDIEMQRMNFPLFRLVNEPANNLQKIRGWYLLPYSNDLLLVIDTLNASLEKHTEPENRAALHILLSDAILARKLRLKLPRDKCAPMTDDSGLPYEVFDGLLTRDGFYDQILDEHALLLELVSDFTLLPHDANPKSIHRMLIAKIHSILANPNSKGLPHEIRQAVMEKFIMSKAVPMKHCPARQRAAICSNLNLTQEIRGMVKDLQTSTDHDALMLGVQIAANANLEDEAIGLANRLMSIIDLSNKHAKEHCCALNAYLKFRPQKALEQFDAIKYTGTPTTTALFLASCKANQYNSAEKRYEKWILPWVVDIGKHGDLEIKREVLSFHHAIINELMEMEDYQNAAFLSNKIYRTDTYSDNIIYWHVALQLAKCHEALGMDNDALKVLEKLIENHGVDKGIREMAQQRMNRIKSKNREAN